MRRALALLIPALGVAAIVVVVFALVVLGLGRPPDDVETRWLAVSMVAAAVCALAYVALHGRLARLGSRLAYGERRPQGEPLQALTSGLTRELPTDELLLELAGSLRRRLALDAAELWTGSGGRLGLRASDPERAPATLVVGESEMRLLQRGAVSGRTWLGVWLPRLLEPHGQSDLRVAPITESGELLGLVVVARDAGGEPFASADELVLQQLGRQVGLALRNSQLESELRSSLDQLTRRSEELRLSRARLVSASDAERRRIERDLHDGAQQHLISLAAQVGLARDLADSDPAETRAVLERVRAEIRGTINELRDLAHGIYPPLLLERGLGEALNAALDRRAAPGRVEASIERYSTEVESTIYFCCLEALQNTAKHGGNGARVTIRIWEEAGGVLFEVRDDGGGFDLARSTAGAGLTNMRDRLGAIGGTLVIAAAPGEGTRVRGAIPLETPQGSFSAR